MVLRSLACRLYSAPSPAAVLPVAVEVLELCMARYSYCRSIMLEYVNEKLERLGAEPIPAEDFRDAESLVELVESRIRDYVLPKLVGARHLSREQLVDALRARVASIFYSSLMAVLDLFNIECPLAARKAVEEGG